MTLPAARNPRYLQPGDTVAIVSPASPIEPAKLEKAVHWLEQQSYQVRIMPHVFDRDHYLAGTDQDRASDLQTAFLDPEINLVYCSRGGYGCARLLPHLNLDQIVATGKLFAGFSDVTTLHLALNRRGLATLHAPMALSLSVERQPWVFESLASNLRGDPTVPASAPRGHCIVPGTATAPVTGGCLCLLTDSLGTIDGFDPEGKIVLIEDVDEPPHRVDAMLTHLLNLGQIQKAAGIVVGEMTRSDEKPDDTIGPKPWVEIVKERLQPLGIPMIFHYPFGHIQNMLTLPMGLVATLDAEAGTLTYNGADR
jgi:muramoyltetrapeptide carboxypeptidase